MSFYTTLYFYRPGKPPVVTGPAFADFLAGVAATGVLERVVGDIVTVKFGRSIDQDDKDTLIEEPVPGIPTMSTVRSIEFDLCHHDISFDDALGLLRNHDRPIYRASVHMGTVRPDVTAWLSTTRPDDGQANLCLWDCTATLGPVGVGSMSSDATFMVGWMGVSFSGQGYFYPWTPRDLTDRAIALPALQPVMDLCRATWPLDPDNPGGVFATLAPALRRRRERSVRRRMGDLWPFAELDRPWDWYWGVAETG